MYGYFEDDVTELATPTEACREYARNVGHERPEDAWILTNYDTWEPTSTVDRLSHILKTQFTWTWRTYNESWSID